MKPRPGSRSGFTLAEVAVTIALVGLALAWMLQVLNAAKLNAAQARNLKLSRELALLTLGQIESGLFADEIDDERIDGTYAEEGYPDFGFEAVIGDENFRPDEDDVEAFDNWRHEQDLKRRNRKDDEEEEAEQPYEKIQVKVTFPQVQELKNEYVLERWVPWKQLHPDEEGQAAADEESTGAGSQGGSR
jgi:prepilin-type N-terminal cleavage/methylation domain-containing protein